MVSLAKNWNRLTNPDDHGLQMSGSSGGIVSGGPSADGKGLHSCLCYPQ